MRPVRHFFHTGILASGLPHFETWLLENMFIEFIESMRLGGVIFPISPCYLVRPGG